jgi:tRNA(His) 5'-end guanylyltransferase
MERMMRERETYSRSTVRAGGWPILRVDGRGFTAYTARAGYDKPFDPKFRDQMVRCARLLLVEMDGVYATTHSDEISVAMHPGSGLFNRRAEKLASLAAGIVSAEFGQAFDGRVSVANYTTEVADYFSWRQADAGSNALSSLAYWTLRKKGKSQGDATALLKGVGAAGRRDLLLTYGMDADEMDLWMRRGLDLSRRYEEKPGWNPKTQESVVAQRSLIDIRAEVPTGDEYRAWLNLYLAGQLARNRGTGAVAA